jgi:hypothetical protein
MKYNNLKKTVESWSQKTFLDSLEEQIPRFSEKDVEYLRLILSKAHLGIGDAPMTGWAFEGLPRTQEQKTYKIRFSDAFHEVLGSDELDPVIYMLKLMARIRKKYSGFDKEPHKVSGYLARALRSLTSFLREPAFAEDLKHNLIRHDARISISCSSDMDAQDHTDVKLVFRGKTYRIWIYQLSQNGLPHDIERVAGERGPLPAGIHILCPLDSKPAMELGALGKQIEAKKKQLEKWIGQRDAILNRATKAYASLHEKIGRAQQYIKNKEGTIAGIEDKLKGHLDVINGSFFYAEEYVSDVAKRIREGVKTDSYVDVKRTMNVAKEYLSQIHFFEVEQQEAMSK